MHTISYDELADLLGRVHPWALLDVRDAAEYEAGHIPGATALPRREIEFRVRELVPAPGTSIVLCDGADGRADLAARTLGRMGYGSVRSLAGGVAAWAAAGRALAMGVNVPSKAFGERLHVEEKVPEIDPRELAARLARGDSLEILDVRTPEEHRRSCIPGALNVPNGDLVLRGYDLERAGTTVVVHCAGRTRSIVGAATLQRLGVHAACALRNGTMGWRLAGLLLEARPGRPTPRPSAASLAAAERVARRLAVEEGVPSVSVDALLALREVDSQQTLYLFDVRSAEEYAQGHIPGARSVPGGQAVQAADDYVAVKNAAIVFGCDGFARGAMAAYWFRRMGFDGARVLDGGVHAWRQRGLPLETGLPSSVPAEVERARGTVSVVAPADLAGRLAAPQPPLVLDVGTSLQYESRHVPGARWISRGWLELKVGACAGDRRSPLVTTCRTGEHSILAAAALSELAYTDVAALGGG
ncbi:MAG: sulfurtransferase, partial [Candidatus Rokubacteria bacterium]|nr:sulfurtransferase [Candidatus Rokubacteria bacterium]